MATTTNCSRRFLSFVCITLLAGCGSGARMTASEPGAIQDNRASTGQHAPSREAETAPKAYPAAAPTAQSEKATVKATEESPEIQAMRKQLEQILSGNLPPKESAAARIVHQARDSRAASLAPMFLEIAKKYSAPDSRYGRLAFEALHAAAVVADIREQLLRFAQDYQRNPGLARYSILILGREPDEKTMAILRQIRNAPESGNFSSIRGAISYAEVVCDCATQLNARKEPRAKIDWLLTYSRFQHLPIDYGPRLEPVDPEPASQYPDAVWMFRKLKQLSQEHPAVAARAVFDRMKAYESKKDQRRYRDHLVPLLAPAAQEEFRELQEAEEASPKK